MIKLDFEKPSYDWCVYRSSTFTVVVHGWSRKNFESYNSPYADQYAHHWNVYANLFEGHPYYNDKEKIETLPFHGGITYDQHITHEGIFNIGFPKSDATTTVKIGSDYGHLYDDWYAQQNPKDGVPLCIQEDARILVERLHSAFEASR